MKKKEFSYMKKLAYGAFALIAIFLGACSGENGVDGRDGVDGKDGKDGVSVTDTLYIIQKDTVIFSGDTIYINKKDTLVVKDTVYIVNGNSGSGTGNSESVNTGTGGEDPNYGTLVDERDGQTYKTVKIGDQVWMAENLNYEINGSMCYENEQSNCDVNGRLYKLALADSVCPDGWHLPSRNEFETLLHFVDSAIDSIITYRKQHAIALVDGIDVVSKYLRDFSWNEGFNSFGFSALPVGYYIYRSGWYDLGGQTFFLSSSEESDDFYYLNISSKSAGVGKFDKKYNADNGLSVRCLQDEF
ncbi:MAG: fibrobacter succinogenes major paralogous domain-containing protein [Fibrobacter sp.]|nr:fibrobacter succinogenes major paralogous domain-containing protein [Fibrobacter sp.]